MSEGAAAAPAVTTASPADVSFTERSMSPSSARRGGSNWVTQGLAWVGKSPSMESISSLGAPSGAPSGAMAVTGDEIVDGNFVITHAEVDRGMATPELDGASRSYFEERSAQDETSLGLPPSLQSSCYPSVRSSHSQPDTSPFSPRKPRISREPTPKRIGIGPNSYSSSMRVRRGSDPCVRSGRDEDDEGNVGAEKSMPARPSGSTSPRPLRRSNSLPSGNWPSGGELLPSGSLPSRNSHAITQAISSLDHPGHWAGPPAAQPTAHQATPMTPAPGAALAASAGSAASTGSAGAGEHG